MIGKLIAVVAFVASVSSANCGFYTTGDFGFGCNRVCGGSVLNVAPSFRVASSCPPCSPVAVPSCVVEPIKTISAPVSSPVTTQIVSPVTSTIAAPVFSSVAAPVVSPVASPITVPEVVDCGCNRNFGYFGGCGSRLVRALC